MKFDVVRLELVSYISWQTCEEDSYAKEKLEAQNEGVQDRASSYTLQLTFSTTYFKICPQPNFDLTLLSAKYTVNHICTKLVIVQTLPLCVVLTTVKLGDCGITY